MHRPPNTSAPDTCNGHESLCRMYSGAAARDGTSAEAQAGIFFISRAPEAARYRNMEKPIIEVPAEGVPLRSQLQADMMYDAATAMAKAAPAERGITEKSEYSSAIRIAIATSTKFAKKLRTGEALPVTSSMLKGEVMKITSLFV